MINNTISNPIGITIPIRNGDSGYFEQSFDTLTQIKTNIINLLNTRPGERRLQPTFGSRLWELVFEQNIENFSDIVSNIIKEDISRWISGATIIDVTSNILKSDQIINNTDIYRLQIAVSFLLNITNQKDTVIITVDNLM